MPLTWIFQQDNCSIHVSRTAKHCFQDEQIRTMMWPTRSPDLNPIENLWGILGRAVYVVNKQYRSERELYNAIVDCWNNISRGEMEKLIQSMHKRCISAKENRGGTLATNISSCFA